MSLDKALGLIYATVSSWVVATIKMLPNLVVAIFALVIFWVLGRVAAKLIYPGTLRVSRREHLARLFSTVVQLAVFLLGVILALDILNLEKGAVSLLAGLGILGVAFGFASQNIAQNFIAGTLLIFWRPLRVGDLIRIGDFFGFIESINMHSTTGVSLLGHKSILPNKNVLGSQIQNFTANGAHRLVIACGVSLENDLRRVEELVLKAVESLELRHPDLPVEVLYEEFAPKSVNFTVRFWSGGSYQNYAKTRSEAIKAVKQILEENDITFQT